MSESISAPRVLIDGKPTAYGYYLNVNGARVGWYHTIREAARELGDRKSVEAIDQASIIRCSDDIPMNIF